MSACACGRPAARPFTGLDWCCVACARQLGIHTVWCDRRLPSANNGAEPERKDKIIMSKLEELQNEAARIVSANSVSYRNTGPAITGIRELIRQAHVAGYQLRDEDERAADALQFAGARTLEIGRFLLGSRSRNGEGRWSDWATAVKLASDRNTATWLTSGGKRIAIIAPADSVYAPEDEPKEKPQHR